MDREIFVTLALIVGGLYYAYKKHEDPNTELFDIIVKMFFAMLFWPFVLGYFIFVAYKKYMSR